MKTSLFILGIVAALSANAAVYEFQLSVKTTTPVETTMKASSNPCGAEGKVAYRKPSTMKIRAVAWGEECEMGAGFAIWNETKKVQYSPDSEFAWEFLNRIGKSGTDAEGFWIADLLYGEDIHAAHLYGGATGKVKNDNQVSLSGNLAGFMYAGQIVKTSGTCTFCQYGIEVTTLDALAWGLCDCAEADERTVAHGTWTLKYNSTASKKYDKDGDIATAYRFPSYVTP